MSCSRLPVRAAQNEFISSQEVKEQIKMLFY